MSKTLLYLRMDPYLAQWFINDQGGSYPVTLTRGSAESKLLEIFLAVLPAGKMPDLPAKGDVAIEIPAFRHKPPQTYRHLPDRARAALLKIIRSRFDIMLFSDLMTFDNLGSRQDELIYAWLEKHNIEQTETNWCAVAKRFQRLRNIYLKREWSKNNYRNKKSE